MLKERYKSSTEYTETFKNAILYEFLAEVHRATAAASGEAVQLRVLKVESNPPTLSCESVSPNSMTFPPQGELVSLQYSEFESGPSQKVLGCIASRKDDHQSASRFEINVAHLNPTLHSLPFQLVQSIASVKQTLNKWSVVSDFDTYHLRECFLDPGKQLYPKKQCTDQGGHQFNKEQTQIIHQATEMFMGENSAVLLVQGPPGSGKTKTISGTVTRLFQQWCGTAKKLRLLVCSPSNLSCDGLALAIMKGLKQADLAGLKLVRLGQEHKMTEDLRSVFLSTQAARMGIGTPEDRKKQVLDNADIVITTLSSCHRATGASTLSLGFVARHLQRVLSSDIRERSREREERRQFRTTKTTRLGSIV